MSHSESDDDELEGRLSRWAPRTTNPRSTANVTALPASNNLSAPLARMVPISRSLPKQSDVAVAAQSEDSSSESDHGVITLEDDTEDDDNTSGSDTRRNEHVSVGQDENEDADEDTQDEQAEGDWNHTARARTSGGKVQVVLDPSTDVRIDHVEDCTAGEDVIRQVIKSGAGKNQRATFVVEFEDRHIEEVSMNELLKYDGGLESFRSYSKDDEYPENSESSADEDDYDDAVPARPIARKQRSRPSTSAYVNTIEALKFLDDEDEPAHPSRGTTRKSEAIIDPSDVDERPAKRTRTRNSTIMEHSTRRSTRGVTSRRSTDSGVVALSDNDDDNDGFILQSDILPSRTRRRSLRPASTRPLYIEDDDDAPRAKTQRSGLRQSGRATRHQGDMQEPTEADIFRSESEPRAVPLPKPTGAKEYFIELPRSDPFRARHLQQCDSCNSGTNFAPLIYCQGCCFAYHKSCISTRSNREHLTTKIGHRNFVLQCRRCVAFPRKKDPTAPDHGKCSDCKEHGASCRPFRERKTTAQEHKDREENGGEDPIYPVSPDLINNPDNVMFRCTGCYRAFHFEHLPPKTDIMDLNADDKTARRIVEYSQDWHCHDCATAPGKVGGIIAWKPIDEDSYDPRLGYEMVDEDEKAYLLRWEGKSYFRSTWMPGPWVWGVTAGVMRKAFAKRDDSRMPKMTTDDAIPEDYLRADIVLDVKYTSYVDISTEEIDKARIREVKSALIKFKGLGYEDAVWEKPPTPEDEDRWTDFVVAYNDWVLGKHVKQPKAQPLKTRLEKARSLDFEQKLEKKKQPDMLSGGELMKYQMDGLNWLYYKWYTQKNAILADEMGLGKTIQIIGFFATLVDDWKCFPFLVVVPNSTCANWRREIKQWAPSLRVVAYFGSKEARDLTYRHELYPGDSKELKCHVVVTSFECAADDGARRFFRNISWQALIVDEGQRLKSDKTILYSALGALRAPFKILLTGTPLQNNARELFNLLQFLDDSFDAAALETRYENLDSAKILELHDLIRPFFLRRTKAQVLSFLPPMAQVIVPVSMSSLQKKLYKSILAKNPDLLKAIFGGARELNASQRASLNNILMQLRKCLCHPFVYNQGIEERNVTHAVSHRNLVDASGKLQLLELLLPKLKERGHRVLIFSQFLDMLNMVEDFLDGMEMQYQRLDGSMSSLTKQRRIDEFNAPDSPLFAFLLSTRAGGVGINLATADTVIIMDPDFNPHQDIQALSRAHRIGQKKKVTCFQLVTRASAEERIMQYGKKKMALDHVLIEQMDADDATDRDLEGILRHGAAELFEDSGEKDIKYDDAAIDRLLEASNVEHTNAGADKSAESTFSFARVWANDGLAEQLPDIPEQEELLAPNTDVWDKILKERERVAAAEAAAAQEAFGRGRRAKALVDYVLEEAGEAGADAAPGLSPVASPKKKPKHDDSDTDFQIDSDADDVADDVEKEVLGALEAGELQTNATTGRPSKFAGPPTFRRVKVPKQPNNYDDLAGQPMQVQQTQQNNAFFTSTPGVDSVAPRMVKCVACQNIHALGSCPLKIAGVEYCNLCGVAHYGHARTCPHISSETQVREMLAAVKQSPEAGHLKEMALKYLTGLKGTLVQKKKRDAIRAKEMAAAAAAQAQQAQSGGGSRGFISSMMGGFGLGTAGYDASAQNPPPQLHQQPLPPNPISYQHQPGAQGQGLRSEQQGGNADGMLFRPFGTPY